jgi:probable F420-dependent oxidoreductase
MTSLGSRAQWMAKCRRAESIGYDVISVPDHAGMPAPFPAMMLAAEATQHVRVGTFVLNTPFYNPTVLARDVATVDQLTGGRVELGLGAGFVRAEFDAADIPFPSGGERVEHVAQTAATIRSLFADENYRPRPAQAGGPPLLIAGWGERMLRVAAQHADIVALTGATTADNGHLTLTDPAETARRIGDVRRSLGDRAKTVEINVLIQALILPRERESVLKQLAPFLTVENTTQLNNYIGLLVGTPERMADQICDRQEKFGINYITVLECYMEKFAPLIRRLR